MSSNNKATEIKEDTRLALVPKLRFPEFRGAKEWDRGALGHLADFVTEKIPLERVALENYVSTENILADYGGVTRSSKLPTTGLVTQYSPYDTLVSNIRPYLKKVWVADKEGGASNDVIVIRGKQRLFPQFLSYLLKNDAFISYVMTGAKGVKMPRGDLGSMKAYPTLYPSIAEQKRIADCLSSLDELIAAQGHKVETLKTHKKGLMQQLFPRERETQPRLRFPQFWNAGQWEVKKLMSFCNVGDIDHKMPPSVGDGIPYIMTGNFFGINDIDFENAKKVSEADYEKLSRKIKPEFGDIAIARYASVGAVRYIETRAKFLISYSCAIIKCSKFANSRYLYYILQSDAIQSKLEMEVNPSSQKNIGIDSIKELTVFLPLLPEQQEIAECLATLDASITAESKKVESLKTHKNGLMQQLFPSSGAIEA